MCAASQATCDGVGEGRGATRRARTGVEMILISSVGRLPSSTGISSRSRSTSMPPTSLAHNITASTCRQQALVEGTLIARVAQAVTYLPNTECFRSRWLHDLNVM